MRQFQSRFHNITIADFPSTANIAIVEFSETLETGSKTIYSTAVLSLYYYRKDGLIRTPYYCVGSGYASIYIDGNYGTPQFGLEELEAGWGNGYYLRRIITF